MPSFFQKPLPVGLTGEYTFTFSPTWLGSATISTATVTVPEGNASVGATGVSNNVVSVRLTGVTAGYCTPHCEITTSDGRGDCLSGRLVVNEC